MTYIGDMSETSINPKAGLPPSVKCMECGSVYDAGENGIRTIECGHIGEVSYVYHMPDHDREVPMGHINGFVRIDK